MPGTSVELIADGSSVWKTTEAINGSFGPLWRPSIAVQYFIDNGGSDTANDGLGTGTTGAFATLPQCVSAAYGQLIGLGGVKCSHTAGQTVSPASFVQAFNPLPGANGATLQFNSATPGTQWTWNCPSGLPCLQVGDLFLGGVTDINFVGSATATQIILGHNYGVLDVNTNVTIGSSAAVPSGFGCDLEPVAEI
jgi:hypothetical protein